MFHLSLLPLPLSLSPSLSLSLSLSLSFSLSFFFSLLFSSPLSFDVFHRHPFANIELPRRIGSLPLSIIHPISTVNFHNVGVSCPHATYVCQHTGVFTRIFGKSVKGCAENTRVSRKPRFPPILLPISRADVRQRLLYNPRIIQFPSRRHAQLRIITAVLFRQTESEKQFRDCCVLNT